MLDVFQSHIRSRGLLSPDARYLLASSGGRDSMCLGDLLLRSGVEFEVAHVNFQLRGAESEGDGDFIRKWCEDHQLTFHQKNADTSTHAQEKGISIQMAAREIRYTFFEELRASRALSGVLLAHHEDDQLETIFLNLLRGTGIEGIYGMADRKGWLIRPLLPFTRAQIDAYMIAHHLPWRDDSSNEKADYKRNNLRIHGLPAIYALEEDARKNLLTSFQRLRETGRAFSGLFDAWKTTHIREAGPFQYLPLEVLKNQPGAATLLHFWLRPFGFNPDQTQAMADALTQPQTGRIFQTPSHWLHFDRKELILAPNPKPFDPIHIPEDGKVVHLPEGDYILIRQDISHPLDRNPEHAQLDSSRLIFPLLIRRWEEGDRFVPLGMTQSKKISDFLIDNKIPLAKKQDVKVLVSGSEIAWVIGLRIADWAKCTPATDHILYFKKS